MLDRTSTLNVDLAKQFAWLLRKDLRETYVNRDAPGFDEWWLIKGRQEFAGWADAAPTHELQALFAPNGIATVAGVTFEVPKVATLLAKHRPDALREFTQAGEVNNEKFFAWVVVRGLAEHHLLAHVPKTLLAVLDQPLPDTVPLSSDTDAPPAATLLMYLLWLLMDKAIQDSKNLFTPNGRKSFMVWFFGAVQTLGIGPLVAGRWKSWVKTQDDFKTAQIAWAQPLDRSNINPPTNFPQTDKPFGLNIYGFAYGELGIGEDLRMAVECCEAANIPYHVVNVDAGETGQADRHLKDKVKVLPKNELPPYNTNLFCLPAFDTVSRVFMPKGAAVFEGYRNIGWWPWELSVFPKAWKPYAFELVDEVWASSQFLYDMYKKSTTKVVSLVPLAASVERIKVNSRAYYNLQPNTFLFLFVFDFNSSVARKNPEAVLRVFKEAFESQDQSVGLVLKVMNATESNIQWREFMSSCKNDPRITVIKETMERPDLLGLINVCDAYISLHRAEGFGRTLAEAMLLKKTVVGTGYSGNVDFMKDIPGCYLVKCNLQGIIPRQYHWIEESDNAFWAEADLADAVDKIKKVFFERNEINAGEQFSPQNIATVMLKELKKYDYHQ